MDVYYAGVDVGTGSARAVIIDQKGNILGLSERSITRHELKENFITQSSTEIWNAICYCLKNAISQSGVDNSKILGLGFDATCSLVVINNTNNNPIAVGPDFTNNFENIILWMDHRAVLETEEINKTNDECLKYVGGKMSIEMELPKIKWLKNNLSLETFKKCKFYDLADYLTFKATNKETRSLCSTVCKQGYLPQNISNRNGWSESFLSKIGLKELCSDNFVNLGGLDGINGHFSTAGETIGNLSEIAAKELGLTTDCFVGSGVIDAYAGWVGTVAAPTNVFVPKLSNTSDNGLNNAIGRLAAVAGTSTCHICISDKKIFVPGVWGPYPDILGKNYWAAEGGQSMTGALLAHVLTTNPAYPELGQLSESSNLSKFEYLNSRLENLKNIKNERSVVSLAKFLFFYGDFHGNRSPIADSNMRASIIGQSMDTSLDSLAIEYLAACEFIGQQTRQIIETMENSGHEINAIFMSGGQCRNGLLMRLLADCTGKAIIIPRYIDASVVFGAAILGAVAADDALESLQQKSQFKSKIKNNPIFSKLTKVNNLSPPSSPYTAPTATTSVTSISALNKRECFPFPTLEKTDDDDVITFDAKSKLVHPNKENTNENEHESCSEKLWKMMSKLSTPGNVIFPSSKSDPDRILLDTKYRIFLDQIETQQKYREMIINTENKISGKYHK